MLDKSRQPGQLQDKAMTRLRGVKVKGKRAEFEDMGPILRTD